MGINNIFKQLIFDKSIFKVQKRIPKNELGNVTDYDRQIKEDLSKELSKEILKRESIQYVNNDKDDFVTYYSELIVINPKHLKIVVEAVISMLSDEQIKNIKSGDKNL